MQRSVTANRRRWSSRVAGGTATTLIVALVALGGTPAAYAIDQPRVDPGAVPPPDGPPGPAQPMRQQSICQEVDVLPGSDFRVQPKYMDMLNLPEAWRSGRGAGMKVAVIDTGVSPHPRLPHLIPGGDYVAAGGDGLSDCDAHGTIVASMIGAAPAAGAAPAGPVPRKPLPVPTVEPPPPPQTITLSQPPPPPPQTVIINPPAPQSEEPPGGQPGQPPAPGAAPGPGPGPNQGGGPAPGPGGGGAPGAVNRGGGRITAPSYSGGRRIGAVDNSRPAAPPLEPPATGPSDAFVGVAPDVDIISIRQSSQAFTPKDAFGGDEDPQTRQNSDNIRTMARAIVHAADMGAQVINISNATCMSSHSIIDQGDLGAAIRYAAVDKNVVIVAAAGDTSTHECKPNPIFGPMLPNDPRDWSGVTTVVTPAWFSEYVLTVGAVNSHGTPMTSMSVAGPWVSIAAPGTDVVGFSPRDDNLVNAIDGRDNTLLTPSGTGFATAIVSGVAALVRAKYPQLTSHQIINRLIRTAHAPARGVDNQVGYGIVDPVAALTWDVPDGPALPEQLGAPLNVPPPPPRRNMTPVWVAAGGLGAALLVAGAVFGSAMLMRRSPKGQ